MLVLASMVKVFIIEDDVMMAECLELATLNGLRKLQSSYPDKLATDNYSTYTVSKFTNIFDATQAINQSLPNLIILDILLSGPDGFSLLNELMTYNDTATIPIMVVSSLDLSQQNLAHYGVVRVFQKETMTPLQLSSAVQEILANA